MDKTLTFEVDPKWEKMAIEMMDALEKKERNNAKQNDKRSRMSKRTIET